MQQFRFALALAAAALLSTGVLAQPQTQPYPSRPIKIIVPFPAGGGSDVVARNIAERMRASFAPAGVIIENKPGASGNVGAEAVRTSPPDGYTLMLTAAPFAIAPALYSNLPFDPVRDFTPITQVATVPLLIVVKADAPYRDLGQLIEAARRRPDEISFASFGLGSPPHIVGEIINRHAGVRMLHVPYRGGQSAMVDIMAGRTTVGILDAVSTAPQVQAGLFRALAITGPKRSGAFPEVPTLAQAGIPFEAVGWHALFGPAALPNVIAERLNSVVNEVIARPDVKAAIETGGSMPIEPATTLAQWRERFKQDVDLWGKAASESGARVE